MGEGMLVTVGALMPGGVLPPAIQKTERHTEQPQHMRFFSPQDIMEKFQSDQPPIVALQKCQRGWSSGPVKTLNVRADFFSHTGLQENTIIRSESWVLFCITVKTVLMSNKSFIFIPQFTDSLLIELLITASRISRDRYLKHSSSNPPLFSLTFPYFQYFCDIATKLAF